MVVFATIALVLACVRAALVFPWLVRGQIMRLLLFGAVVYVGLPIQADQAVFWNTALMTATHLQNMYRAVADPLNRILGCIEPLPVAWNRFIAVPHAVLIVFTDVIGFDDGFRDAPTPLVAETYCEYSHRMSALLQQIVCLVEVPVLLFFEVLREAIDFVSDIEDLSFWSLLVSIFTDFLADLLGFTECFNSWENAMFCLCSPPFRKIWDSPADVPDTAMKAWTKCIYPPYDGVSDPLVYGLYIAFGFVPVLQAYESVCSVFERFITVVRRIAQTALDLAGVAQGIFGKAGILQDKVALYNDNNGRLPDLHADYILAPFAAAFYDSVNALNVIVNTLPGSCPAAPVFVEDAGPRAPRAMLRAAANRTAGGLLARLPAAWDRALARAGATGPELALWVRVLGVARAALAADAPVDAHALAARMRAAGVDFRALPYAPPPRCAAAAARAAPRQLRAIELVDDSWWTAAVGVPAALFLMLVLALLFPPAVAFLIGLTALSALSGALVLVSGTALEMATAAATGELDRALALPALVYTAQYVGRAYFAGGLLTLDGLQYVAGVLPELEADAEYVFQLLADRPACSGLVTPFCLPAPRRGESPLARLVGAIQCEQDRACSTVADCAGRAKACVAGKCLCWMYMPIGVRLPTLTIAASANPACEQYGYTNEGLLPRQTGGLSWTNAANTFANFRAAAADGARALAHRRVSYNILGVAAFTFVPLVRGTARTLTRYAVAVAAAQLILSAANDALGWIGPPDHGLACAVYAAPSVVLWTGLLYVLAMAAAAVVGAGIASSLLLLAWALVRFGARGATLAYRAGRPYARWWRGG